MTLPVCIDPQSGMTSLPVCLEIKSIMIRKRGTTLLVIRDLWCGMKSVVGDEIARKRIFSADKNTVCRTRKYSVSGG